MDREKTLELALSIRRKIQEGAISIRWPSSEMLSSSSDRRSTRRGAGDEHDGMKEYEPGDDLRHVDWAATAAGDASTVIIKTFFEPRIVRFNVLLDVNASMNFGTTGTLKSRLAALCAACGIYSAGKVKDRVSYASFAAGEPVSIRKNQGASRVLTDFLIHSFEDGKTAVSEGGTNEGGGLAASFNALRKEHRSIVLVVSDFINMSEDDWEALRVSGFKNDTVAVFVQDIRERELPEVPWPGASYSFEDYNGAEKTIFVTPDASSSGFFSGVSNAIVAAAARLSGAGTVTSRSEYRENFRKHEAKILDRLESYGIKTVVVSTEEETDAVRNLLRVLANKMR